MIPNEVNIVLKDIWPMLLLFIIVVFTMRVIDIIINNKKVPIYKDLRMLVFILYMFLLFELVTSTDFESYSNNFVPFKEILRYSFNSALFYKNVLGNVLLFIPFGYFVNVTLKNKNLWISIIITFITSLSIELIQMNIGRSFDIDDILLNLIGGIFGYYIYKFLDYIKNKLPEFLQKEWIYSLLWIIILVLGLLFLFDYYGIWEVL